MLKFVKNMGRSVYNYRYTVKGSFNLGEICPIGSPIEITPGDEHHTKMGIVIRMATPIAPIMDDLDAEVTAHFVPLRLIGSKYGDITATGAAVASSQASWEKVIGNGLGNPADWVVTDNELYSAPTATWTGYLAKTAGYTSIGEALGLGLGCGSNQAITVLAYPLYGYNLIYQERFRNQDVEAAKVTLDLGSNLYGVSGSDTATSGTDTTYNHALSVAYKHGDYFTNAKPAPQKGAAVQLNLGTVAPVITMDPSDSDNIISQQHNLTWETNRPNTHPAGAFAIGIGLNNGASYTASPTNVSGISATYDTDNLVAPSNLWADLSNATASTINQFIMSYNLQRLLMRDIKGSRYYEVVKNHYGIENDDIRLYIPELLNVKTFAINISPVVQQSGAAAATSGTDQGNYLGTTGGYSFTAKHNDMLAKAFGEFGYVYFLIVIRQRHTYGQGVPRKFLRSTRFDWFFPELGRDGYRAIDNRELNADVALGTVYGYTPDWDELRRVNENQVFGFMNPAKNNSLDYWTLAENYATTPTLSMSFLKENRANLARALTIGNTGPDFIMDAVIYGKLSTLVPVGSDPKLFN